MIKKVLTYLIFVLTLSGCTDSLENPFFNSINDDGEVNINFYIPRVVTRRTRSIDPEYQVDDIQVLIYKGEEGSTLPVQTEHIFTDINQNTAPNKLVELDDNKIRLTFRLNEALRAQSGLRFYFLANCAEDVTAKTENDLGQDMSAYITKISDDGSVLLTMCGKTTLQEILDNTLISLYRNAAKVSVSNKVPTADDSGTVFYPYSVLGSADESSFISGLTGVAGKPTTVSEFPADVSVTAPGYYHPTANEENVNTNIGGSCFVITKAKYGENEYFYRLDFTSPIPEDEEGASEYISLLSNHWYQFVILDVTAPGYSTPKEAAKHPENGIKYEIHDHCVESYSMISDGFRELGVSRTIEYDGLASIGDSWSDKALYIKFFSKDESDIPAPEKVRMLWKIEDESWLELSDAEIVTDEIVTGGDAYGSDLNDKGVVYKIKIKYKQVDGSGTLYNKVTVRWEGLEREIPLIWKRNFKGADITTATLSINYDNSNTVIDDYWGFLSSTDDPANLTYASDNLWGIQPDANNGKVRNDGLHFPVMYGSGDNFAQYTYTLQFNKGKYLNRNDYTWQIEVTGDDTIVGKVSASAPNSYPLTITITRPGKVGEKDYTYGTGMLKVVVTSADGTKDTYSFSLYHTGFFHKETPDAVNYQLYGPMDEKNYFYYEVVPVKVDGENRYILDRNLSAKSAQDYIRDSDGTAVAGNPDAAGAYYIIARQGEKYEDPVILSNIAPPGYRVPKKNAWDAIRLSNAFHTESNGRYYQAYYESGNSKVGKIYFPKSMLYMGNGFLGESRAGYYWTETPASGTEKDEIGRWLNMFMITGNSTSFINGYVLVDNNRNQAYGASIRCINNQTDEAVEYRTSFNVAGATHVFLYTENNGVRTSTTSWPGHPIGNYATMSEDYNWFNFVYSSTQFNPENLYVLFNFVDEAGIINTYSRNTVTGNTEKSTDKSPSKIHGWKVVGENIPSLKPSGNKIFESITLEPFSGSTMLGDWWQCGGTGSDPYVKVYRAKP